MGLVRLGMQEPVRQFPLERIDVCVHVRGRIVSMKKRIYEGLCP